MRRTSRPSPARSTTANSRTSARITRSSSANSARKRKPKRSRQKPRPSSSPRNKKSRAAARLLFSSSILYSVFSILSDFHDFFGLLLHGFLGLGFVLLGQAVDLVLGALRLVLGDRLALLLGLGRLVAFAADVADRDLRLLAVFL